MCLTNDEAELVLPWHFLSSVGTSPECNIILIKLLIHFDIILWLMLSSLASMQSTSRFDLLDSCSRYLETSFFFTGLNLKVYTLDGSFHSYIALSNVSPSLSPTLTKNSLNPSGVNWSGITVLHFLLFKTLKNLLSPGHTALHV